METVGQIVRAWRKEKKMTQERLGELIGKDQSYISEVETGQIKVPGDTVLLAIANAMEMSPDPLFDAGGYEIHRRVVVTDEYLSVPVQGTVLAGGSDKGAPMNEIRVTPEKIQGARDPYGLYVSGDDLRGFTILSGDVVIVEPLFDRRPNDRQLVVVKDGNGLTLRRWCQRGDAVELEDAEGRIVHRVQAGEDIEVQALFITFEPLAPR
jgi:transcriptional regulator with XRE-family HTH domain